MNDERRQSVRSAMVAVFKPETTYGHFVTTQQKPFVDLADVDRPDKGGVSTKMIC